MSTFHGLLSSTVWILPSRHSSEVVLILLLELFSFLFAVFFLRRICFRSLAPFSVWWVPPLLALPTPSSAVDTHMSRALLRGHVVAVAGYLQLFPR